MTAVADAARWMLAEVESEGVLQQSYAVAEIEDRFDAALIYENASGNPAIHKDVLAEFLKISKDTVVWSRSDFAWRLREPDDEPGRNQP